MIDLTSCLPYRGRFAPSPTGPLHFGSLIAATGSYLQAKSYAGEWQIRIDDIDPFRELPGASDCILKTLEQFGFEWDGPVSYQSQHTEQYQNALDTLQEKGLVYPCVCTRKSIAATQTSSAGKNIYPGTCRNGLAEGNKARMLRINTQQAIIQFEDKLQGHCQYDLENEVGDFVVFRADGLFAYQLATGIDDANQKITEVVRGFDLLDSTPCQIHVQQSLGLSSPDYCHLPIVINSAGQKLSKQNLAPALDPQNVQQLLWQALNFLGQKPDTSLANEPLINLWQWAIDHWQLSKIPPENQISQ